MGKQHWCFVGILVEDRRDHALDVQELLTVYGDRIVGRMGVPIRGKGVCAISLIVEGGSERTEELVRRLGELPQVHVTYACSEVEPG